MMWQFLMRTSKDCAAIDARATLMRTIMDAVTRYLIKSTPAGNFGRLKKSLRCRNAHS
jgi:hypothetical protein